MRITVVSNFIASSQRASVINTVKMAEGFARLGHETTLICSSPKDGKASLEKLKQVYGLRDSIQWNQIPSQILGHPLEQHWEFGWFSLPTVLKSRPNMIFARNYILPALSSKLGIPTVVESHAHTDNRSKPFLALVNSTRHKGFRLWVTISHDLADYYVSLGVPDKKIVILPDAVDLQHFLRPPEPELPPNPFSTQKPNIVYTGHLYDYKGIPIILKAADKLPEFNFNLIGGLPEDILRQEDRIRTMGIHNVNLHGLKPLADVPVFLWHADILLLVPSLHHPSATWTSPMKLGEYLASGKPVIASSIPALRKLLTDEEVLFVEPDDPDALAKGIQFLLNNPGIASSISAAGLKKAKTLSLESRAQKILDQVFTPI
jgi:glycosyltransferase involved in cell wall biosynthesis